MITRKELDLWVGVFLVVGIGAMLFLSLKVANLASFSTSDTYPVTANFDNESFEAVVVLNLDGRYKFPRDTSAKILTSGLLGEQYIGLTAGGDSVNLKSGDALRITQSAVVLENLIGQFLYNKASEGGDGKK
jgi:phospholipid/cholesterol/gamma-HCH transport system substrate-binding protein